MNVADTDTDTDTSMQRSLKKKKKMTIVLWIILINVEKKRLSHAIVCKLTRPWDPLCSVIWSSSNEFLIHDGCVLSFWRVPAATFIPRCCGLPPTIVPMTLP